MNREYLRRLIIVLITRSVMGTVPGQSIASGNMWRAFFLGIGIYLMIAGAECLAVDRVYLRSTPEPAPTAMPFQKPAAQNAKVFPPAPWVPWSLLSTGAVVCLYSFTIPKRMGSK